MSLILLFIFCVLKNTLLTQLYILMTNSFSHVHIPAEPRELFRKFYLTKFSSIIICEEITTLIQVFVFVKWAIVHYLHFTAVPLLKFRIKVCSLFSTRP